MGNWQIRSTILALSMTLGAWQIAPRVSAQALLPYTPKLDNSYLQQQGLLLLEDAVQLARFRQNDMALPRALLATQLAPNDFRSWFVTGTLYIQENKLEEGITALQQALKIAPKEANIYFSLGSAYIQKQEYNEGINQLTTGLKIKPDSPSALFDLGNAYYQVNQISLAIQSYEKAVKVEPRFWPAINNIGLVNYEQGNLKEAQNQWEKAVKIDQEATEPLLALAVSHFSEGHTEMAINMAEKALKLDIRYADLDFLKQNLWGEKLLTDTGNLFSNPDMRSRIIRIRQETPDIQILN